MDVLQNEGGLFKFNIALKLLSFEIDGENILSELIPFYFFNFLFP
jgi:hypothetical protein